MTVPAGRAPLGAVGAIDPSPLLPFVDVDRGLAEFTDVPAPPTELPEVRGLLAGAAEVDITPPPGMPKAGYSKNAHDGAGFRTRLRARAFHLRSGTTSLAVVTLDLLGGSTVLQRLVARALAHRGVDVPLHGLYLGATHTHAGPGQFQGSPFYSRFASNRPGFDPAWSQFLVDRITDAVATAVATRQPARAAIGRTEVWGLTRNRSLAPHLRNTTVDHDDVGNHRKFAAVNPWLHVLRVDVADGPLAALATFSIHGTGISHHAHEYNADVWAYLVDGIAEGIERTTGRRPVVGAMEATHADVAPALRPGQAGYLEAERIGRGIGEAGAALHAALEAHLSDDLRLGAGLREIDLGRGYDATAIDGIALAPPALGASQVAGAKENLTPVLGWLPPFRAGMPKPRALSRGPHGRKWILASRWLQPRILPTADFPSVLPLQALRIGDTLIVGAPFEITVESGRRVREAVLAACAGQGVTDAVVSSVANEYWGYCATAEEYDLQYYEGGHTLHGPTTQPWLAAQAARLAGAVGRGEAVADAGVRTFRLPARRYLARSTGLRAVRRATGAAAYLDPTAIDVGCWEQRWTDVGPGDLDWHEPLVRVERADGTVVADDRSAGRVAVLQVAPGTYAARWYDPPMGRGPQHRFVVLANRGQAELRGELFGSV